MIAESDPEKHPSWNSAWTQQAVDDLYTYNVSASQLAYIAKLEETSSYAEKGVYDYTYAMQRCLEAGTPYIGMFEDDILLADGWLVRTLQAVRQIPPVTQAAKAEWLFMRLFNQERSTGWSSRNIGGNNEFWIILGAGLAISFVTAAARKRYRWASVYLDMETVGVLVLVFIPAMVILFFQAGKASLLPPLPGVFNEPYGCCSQAMVFPREAAPVAIKYLRDRHEGQVDLLLDELAAKKDLTRYAMYPVQAQHIGKLLLFNGQKAFIRAALTVVGLDSARMTLEKEAQAIWSMAYEDLNPMKLKREHGRMVREYYGDPT